MKLFESLRNVTIEREVEDAYNSKIQKYYGCFISHPYACDGLVEKDNLKLLIEYKYDVDMMSSISRANVIIQTVFYMKQFELHGERLPNVIFYADKNECFVLHSNCLIKYLSEENVDWNTAPSQAYMKYVDFVLKIAEDKDVNPYVFDVNADFEFKTVIDKIEDLSKNTVRLVHITEHNIQKAYMGFEKKVYSSKNKLGSKEIVSLFVNILMNRDEYYLHPNKKNCLVTPKGNIFIKSENFNAFFSHFEKIYSPKEKAKFTEIADRLIEDEDRRKSGDFWTPSVFVDYAHKRIAKVFGENWKDEYVVWDCCCGTKNLTRDYNFKELYCSTLFQSELDMSTKYNTNSVSFQFDFLNDDLEKIPVGLMNALKENKKIIFLMNPPYGKGAENGICKGVTKTKINEIMVNKKLGKGSANLYAQFLYRIMLIKEKFNLTDCNLSFFCNPNYMTGNDFNKILKLIEDNFVYKDGFLFNAGHFADCASTWGINFSIWTDSTIDN